MNNRKPTHIHFYDSVEDMQKKRIQRIPIEQAEERIAKHRGIKSFSWLENFSSDEKTENINIDKTKFIDPDKLALCYFGDDIGYAPVAFKKITSGEYLEFTGDLIRKHKVDPENPYVMQNQGWISDAKYKGNFTSMLMDMPNNKIMEFMLKKNTYAEVHSIALSNFSSTGLSRENPALRWVMQANKDIYPGQILGVTYTNTFRYAYPHFIGFDKNAKRLSAKLNSSLNHCIDKGLRYYKLNDANIFLLKLIKKLEKKNPKKTTLFVLENFSKIANTLKYLYDNELNTLELHLKFTTISVRIEKTNKEKIIATLATIADELNEREDDDYYFKFRGLVERLYKINKKQLQMRGIEKRGLIPGSDLHSYHLAYPGIDKDFLTVSKSCKELNLNNSTHFKNKATFFAKRYRAENTIDDEPEVKKQKLVM